MIHSSRTCTRLAAPFLSLAAGSLSAVADPQLTSWMTAQSSTYARVTETTTTTAVATWPSPGIPRNPNSPSQTLPAYADVQQILLSNSFIYIRSADLASHRMGPWYKEYDKITVNGLFPDNGRLTSKIPRHPAPAPAPAAANDYNQVAQGPVGVMVNGVTIANLGDGSGWNPATQKDGGITGGGVPGNQTNVWIRCATGAEGPILDAGFGHPAPDGGYHYHANPRALRYQLNDNLTYQAASDTYSENTTNLHHSPILGWAYDGYPIYGPYGYSIASDAASPVRRMVSGHVPRDTANHTRYGVADLSDPLTKRHSLAPWAALFHTFTTTLGTTDHPLSNATYGPDVSAAFPIGWYAEDFDYLGDRIKPGTTSKFQQGTDFDLDKPNGRLCATPEFPGGTYAYFIPIDAKGAPAFPFSIGRYWSGNRTGGRVINGNITEAVTTWLTAGPATVETWAHGPTLAPESGSITLTWNSLEGSTYKIEATDALGTWNPLVTSQPAAANSSTSTYTTTNSTARRFFRIKRTGNAPFDPAYTGQ